MKKHRMGRGEIFIETLLCARHCARHLHTGIIYRPNTILTCVETEHYIGLVASLSHRFREHRSQELHLDLRMRG